MRALRPIVSLVLCLAIAAISGCVSQSGQVPTSQPAKPDIVAATQIAAYAATVGGLQAVPAKDRAAVATQVAALAHAIATGDDIGTVQGLQATVNRLVAADAKLAPYAVPIDAAAGLLIQGVAAHAKTPGAFAEYARAAAYGVESAARAIAP